MTIIIQQKNQKQKIFIMIFLVMFLVTVFILWQNFFKKQQSTAGQISIINQNEEIKIDFDTLKLPFLKKFQPFFEIQPFLQDASNTEKIGRENPFVPLK